MKDDDLRTGLQTVADREARLLAPYAMHSAQSRGRKHPEPSHAYRGPFQRDRDRIVHSSAFRRLSGKMQVFTGERGDYHRTRMTHTHEVASIARTMARALRLNEDLVEALALFHDIGHPPFGHAGEEALHLCLAGQGGFSHNRYALTIAEELEMRYEAFPGLNLSREVLEGQAMRAGEPCPAGQPLLEVQVVEAADSITYNAHDTDDAVKLGLVPLDELERLALIGPTATFPRERSRQLEPDMRRKALVHDLIDRLVSDLLEQTGNALAAKKYQSAAAAQQDRFRLAHSPHIAQQKQELEQFLYHRVYRHPELVAVRQAAQGRLTALFRAFCEGPQRLPEFFRQRIAGVGLERSVGDYLAGMTDRFCDRTFQQILGDPPPAAAGRG
jgi:dGTPase